MWILDQRPFYFPTFDPGSCCDDNGGNNGLGADCTNPLFVSICETAGNEFETILLCDQDSDQLVIAVVTIDQTTGVPSTAFYNPDGTAFGGTAINCDTQDLELVTHLYCVDGVQFQRVDIVDPSTNPATIVSAYWQDVTGVIIPDPTGGATTVTLGTCQIVKDWVQILCDVVPEQTVFDYTGSRADTSDMWVSDTIGATNMATNTLNFNSGGLDLSTSPAAVQADWLLFWQTLFPGATVTISPDQGTITVVGITPSTVPDYAGALAQTYPSAATVSQLGTLPTGPIVEIISDDTAEPNGTISYSPGSEERFQRCFTSVNGVVTAVDLDLAGNPYTIQGTVIDCDSILECCPVVEQREFCLADGTEVFLVLSRDPESLEVLNQRIEDKFGMLVAGATTADLVECNCLPQAAQLFPICLQGFDAITLDSWITETGGPGTNAPMQWEVFVDNVSQGISNDVPELQDDGTKDSWYTNLVALVNSTSWSMVNTIDPLSTLSGSRPTWQFSGPASSQLRLERLTQTPGDVLTINVDAAGVVSFTFENPPGNPINSGMLQPCP